MFYITGKKGTKDEDKKIPVIGHYFYQGNIRAIQYFTFENGEVLTSDNWSDPDFWPRADLNHFPLTENNITGAGPYIIQAEDTWELIALRLYGDSSYSQLIAAANGRELHERLIPGEELNTLVRPVTLHNNIKTRPVLGLINTQNSFYPTTARFEPPEDLRNYFAQYLAIAAETAVAYALAPATGGGSLLLSELILESVIAGVASNLTGQVINAVAGNQDGIDGKSLLYSGATSALTAGVNFYAANPLGRAAANSGINMAAQFARGREFSEQDLFFTGASNAISLGVNSFVDSSITRGLVTDALDNGLQMAIYSTKSVDWGVMLAHAGGAYLGNKMHDGIAQQRAMRYSELHRYNFTNFDAFLNPYTGSDLTIGGLMSRLDAEIPLSLGFGGAREEVAANDLSFIGPTKSFMRSFVRGAYDATVAMSRGIGEHPLESTLGLVSMLNPWTAAAYGGYLIEEAARGLYNDYRGEQSIFHSAIATRDVLLHGNASDRGYLVGGLAPVLFSVMGGAKISNNKNISNDYGVAFFGKENIKYYIPDKIGTNPNLGANGRPFFFMPLEDAGRLKNSVSVAIETGFAPSAEFTWKNKGDIYGISFPLDNMKNRLPTVEDARGWRHFRKGGYTAINAEGTDMYIVNKTREFVIDGGQLMPKDSVLFRLDDNGSWLPIWRY